MKQQILKAPHLVNVKKMKGERGGEDVALVEEA